MKKPKTIKYTNHVLERMALRKINKAFVQKCVDFGSREHIANAFHYKLDGLVVVLGKSDVSVVTTYWESESSGS